MLDKHNLHGYQLKGLEFIKSVRNCGLFLDMGLGKTVTTLTAIDHLLNEAFEVQKVLIVAPKTVAETVWKQEAKNWKHLAHLSIEIVTGTERQRLTALNKAADIHVISRDNLTWLLGLYGGLKTPFDMLVLDELSSFKSHKSQRFGALKVVAPSFKRIVGLTGTPAPNGYTDLWSQIYLLDRGERLGRNITNFRERFCTIKKSYVPNADKFITTQESEAVISAKIQDICISMKAKDYLDLIPCRIIVRKVQLPSKDLEKYKAFERDKLLEIDTDDETGVVTAFNAAAVSNKLMQYANGAIYDEDKTVHWLHDAKLDALADLIEEAKGEPVLVAYNFQHDRDRLMARFKKQGARELNEKGTDRATILEQWNRKEIPILIAHPASAGHGLNMQKGGHILAWFGLCWSLELYQQFNKRLDRQGQTEMVCNYHFITEGTRDEDVMAALESKDTTQERLLASLKARKAQYL